MVVKSLFNFSFMMMYRHVALDDDNVHSLARTAGVGATWQARRRPCTLRIGLLRQNQTWRLPVLLDVIADVRVDGWD